MNENQILQLYGSVTVERFMVSVYGQFKYNNIKKQCQTIY